MSSPTSSRQLGGEITLATAVNDGQTDMVQVLTNVAESGPELLYFPIFIDEGGFIVDQAADVAGLEDVILFGSDGLFSPKFIEAAGPERRGHVPLGLQLRPARGHLPGDARALPRDRQRRPAPGDVPRAHLRCRQHHLRRASRKSASSTTTARVSIDLGELRSAIYATTDHPGVTGTLTCTENGDCGASIIGIYQVGPETVEDGCLPAGTRPVGQHDSNPSDLSVEPGVIAPGSTMFPSPATYERPTKHR